MEKLAQLIRDAVEQYGDEDAVSFRNGYSGRGMFGRGCVGIVGDRHTCMDIIAQVIKDAHLQSASDDDIEFDSVVDTILDYSQDNMGMDIIIYWSQIPAIEDREPENDGQPDESQEWHDFNPDS